jgi:formylglycine-generating enzyme
MVRCCLSVLVLLPSVLTLATAIAHADVFRMPKGQTSLEFVTVGDPGNAADSVRQSDRTKGYGSVPYVYQIGKYDVTVAQYCEFLNAVAKTDTYSLYHDGMATDMPTVAIVRTGDSGSYRYSVKGGKKGTNREGVNFPIFDVSWGDAARFCNWLHNRQPTGNQGPGTTEAGAYTLRGVTMDANLMDIKRNPEATYFIPTENEWYKAAYYKGGSTKAGYWRFPTQSDEWPSNVLSARGRNNANCRVLYNDGRPTTSTDVVNKLTVVGAFAASPGPYGTFDMGGNVFQWNETAVTGLTRGVRGGCWGVPVYLMSSDERLYNVYYPAHGNVYVGFRVARVPQAR